MANSEELPCSRKIVAVNGETVPYAPLPLSVSSLSCTSCFLPYTPSLAVGKRGGYKTFIYAFPGL